jgi:hypothetical protein
VVKALCYEPEGHGFQIRRGEFFNLPNPSGRTRPLTEWIPEAEKSFFWGAGCGWCVGLTTLLPSVSWLTRQCGILNISHPYRLPRPVTGIALLFYIILADDYPALPGYLIIPILYHTNNIHQQIYIYIKDYTTAIIWFPQQCESSKFPDCLYTHYSATVSLL